MRHPSIKQQYRHTDQPVALILGGTAAGALAAIRGLAQHHIPVIAVESEFTQVHIYSKYCQYLRCPSPLSNEQDYVTFLATIGSLLSTKGVLLPTGDIQNLALLRHQSTLEPYYHFTTPPLAAIEPLLNKKHLYQTLEKLKIAHPQTYYPSDAETLQKNSRNIRYPCIVKPSISALFTTKYHIKALIVQSPQQLQKVYQKISSDHPNLIIQDIIPGSASSNYGYDAYYDHQQNPHGIFAYRRIRDYPLTFGTSCFVEQVNAPELQQPISQLVHHLDYFGLIDADFKYDPRDQTLKLLDINPRIWMQCGFPLSKGINHPLFAYQDALHQPLPSIPTISAESSEGKWLYLLYDIGSYWLQKDTLSFRQWVHSYQGTKTYALFSKDDPLPFILQCAMIFRNLPLMLIHRSSQTSR